ncbi:hypothetical protein ACQ4PT_028539 [Festuca glaucescens]
MAKKVAEELQKAMEEALAEAKATRADAEAARTELEALKGKKADGAAKSQELVSAATVQPVHEEQRRMRFGDPIGGKHLLLSKKQWRSYQSGKGDCGDVRGHGNRRNDEDNSSDSDTSVRSGCKAGKKKGKFYNCGVRGHYSSECRNPKKEDAFFTSADEHPTLM